MIDIYTEKKDSKDWILQNDLYFNLNTSNEEMSQYEINLIRQVDEAKLTPDKHIETKYGLGTIRNLSSGCKTLLNIVKHPDKVVNVEECGPNVLKIIFTMDNIKIYMSRPTLFDIPDASLQWDGLVEAVENSVKTHGISCSQLCLEITEQDAISSTEDVVHKIEELKAHGHRFLIDDFGMGHTSLLYLQTGFFAVVKLDGSLTRNVLENETNAEIIGSITKLGESIHFTTIAEWVESKEQLEKLKALGCDVFQGAYYSRAIGYEDLVEWLISYRDS